MPTRSGVLCRGLSAGAALIQIGVVPVTDTWVIKDWRLYNQTAAPLAVILYVLDQNSVVLTPLFVGNVPANQFVAGSGWVAAMPGATVQLSPGAAGLHAWVSGADLPGHL
jgi:hypothetical protein